MTTAAVMTRQLSGKAKLPFSPQISAKIVPIRVEAATPRRCWEVNFGGVLVSVIVPEYKRPEQATYSVALD